MRSTMAFYASTLLGSALSSWCCRRIFLDGSETLNSAA
jgi:hypothetical protein